MLYPAYASFKAVEILNTRGEPSEAGRWLTYWAVYGSLSAVERLLDKALPWLPYYTTIKLALLLWLQLPRYQVGRGGGWRRCVSQPPIRRPSYDSTPHNTNPWAQGSARLYFQFVRPFLRKVYPSIDTFLLSMQYSLVGEPLLGEWQTIAPTRRPAAAWPP